MSSFVGMFGLRACGQCGKKFSVDADGISCSRLVMHMARKHAKSGLPSLLKVQKSTNSTSSTFPGEGDSSKEDDVDKEFGVIEGVIEPWLNASCIPGAPFDEEPMVVEEPSNAFVFSSSDDETMMEDDPDEKESVDEVDLVVDMLGDPVDNGSIPSSDEEAEEPELPSSDFGLDRSAFLGLESAFEELDADKHDQEEKEETFDKEEDNRRRQQLRNSLDSIASGCGLKTVEELLFAKLMNDIGPAGTNSVGDKIIAFMRQMDIINGVESWVTTKLPRRYSGIKRKLAKKLKQMNAAADAVAGNYF
jgi:hypothetical protein